MAAALELAAAFLGRQPLGGAEEGEILVAQPVGELDPFVDGKGEDGLPVLRLEEVGDGAHG